MGKYFDIWLSRTCSSSASVRNRPSISDCKIEGAIYGKQYEMIGAVLNLGEADKLNEASYQAAELAEMGGGGAAHHRGIIAAKLLWSQ